MGALLTVGASLLLTGCGAAPEPGTGGGGSDARSSAIKVRYESVGGGGDSGDTPALMDVVIDGERFRMEQRDGTAPDRVLYLIVWDGRDLLIEEPGSGPPERLEGAPIEERPGPFVMRAGDAAFAVACPKGTPIGRRTVIGRAGTAYACPAHKLDDDVDVERSEITLDDATGLMLERTGGEARTVALEVTVGFVVDEGAFSTDLPPGAAIPPPVLSSVESLPKVGGGELRLAEVRHGPTIVVIGDLDGLTHVLADIMPLTHDGTRPRTYGLLWAMPSETWQGSLLNLDDEKRFVADVSKGAGTLPVPVGIDIKGSAAGEELRSFDQMMSGTTVVVALDVGGNVAVQVTEDELLTTPEALTDWIEANS